MALENENHLARLPAELLLAIFCASDSFTDVFALATACREMRSIWTNNIPPFYQRLAPQYIKCEIHARRLLAEQHGYESLEISDLTARDVAVLLDNADSVEKAIAHYETRFALRSKFTLTQRNEKSDC